MKKIKFIDHIALEVENTPTCKICGAPLELKQLSKNVFKATSCSNKSCACFNTKSTKIKRLSFFGKECAEKIENERRKYNRLCIEYWLNKGYSEADGFKQIKEMQSRSSKLNKNKKHYTKKEIEEKLGKEESDLYFRKKSRYCIEYWTSRGYTEEDGRKEISNLQKKYSKIANGDIDKIKKRSWRCPEYWMRVSGCTLDEAKEIISKKQVFFSKEKCIEKYGYDEGIRIWTERQSRWQERLHKSGNLHVGYSKISQDLFDEILNHYKEEEKDYVFYGSKNHEYSLRDNNVNYIYDFVDLNKRKIIEFQGDIYHANPKIFEATDTPNPFKKEMTSKELWEFDEKKKDVAIKNGFTYTSVWENDYRNNKEEILKETLKFLEIC